MDIRRFKDIIAVRNITDAHCKDSIVAFHSSNMEVAEISEESFAEMSPISLKNSSIPTEEIPVTDFEAREALIQWSSENTEIEHKTTTHPSFQIKSITININQICNLKCTYCAAGGDGTYGLPSKNISIEKTYKQLTYFISQLDQGSTFYISLIGGEPLLHPNTIKLIYDYALSESLAHDITPIIKIVTNGTLIEKNIALLRSMKVQLLISIDGPQQVNDYLRPSKDGSSSTEEILKGITELNKNRGNIISIELSSITVEGNEDLISNYHFLNSLNTDYIDFIFANEEKSLEVQKAYISQLQSIAAIAWEQGKEKALRRIKLFDHYFNVLDSQKKIHNHCGAGKTYLMIDAKNRLYSCVWDANDPKTSVGQDITINTKIDRNHSKSLIEINNCHSCWAKYLCGGGCMYINQIHSNGDKHKKSSLFCERTRSLISTAIMYYKIARSEQSQ